jgi:signal transduction histidine kinase
VAETLALLKAHHDYRADIEVREAFDAAEVWVKADSNQLRQVIWNLVLNAVQALPGGGRLTVRIRSIAPTQAEGGGRAEMEVSDSGQGIGPEDLQRIFEPFFTTKSGGSGLGLAIVHRIVEEHGGRVDVHSERTKGTRVIVTLPEGHADDDPPDVRRVKEREAVIPVPGSGYPGGFAARYVQDRP